MANSIIKIYQTELFLEKNMILDKGIKDYLDSFALNTYTNTNFQYIKIDNVQLQIKVDLEQSSTVNLIGNYCSIKNSDNKKTYYYYITKTQWLSKKAILLNLQMDTLNTFKDSFVFNEETKVLREHRNRFKRIPNTNQYYRVIDEIDEELNPVLYYDDSKTAVLDEANDLNLNWFLIYKNAKSQTEEAPIDCFLCADKQITISYLKPNNTIQVQDLEIGKFYFLMNGKLKGSNARNYEFIQSTTGTIYTQIPVFYRTENKIVVGLINIQIGANSLPDSWDEINYFEQNSTTIRTTYDNTLTLKSENYYANLPEVNLTLPQDGVLINSIDDLNRTDTTLVKVIRLAYCPVNQNFANNTFSFDSQIFDYDPSMQMLKLRNLSYKFKNEITTSFRLYEDLVISREKSTTSFVRKYDEKSITASLYLESKLFHSAFYKYKFVYDNFNFNFNYENFYLLDNTDYDQYFKFKFIHTTTINSKFLIDFDIKYLRNSSDYQNILLVARNSEETLYNSNYLNYIKNGYNYDKKTKAREYITSIAGFGLGNISNVKDILSRNVSGAIGAGDSAIGLVSSLIANEEAMQQKIESTKLQANSVSGVDDIDLLYYYANGNKAKMLLYECTREIKVQILDLFYYYGYKTNKNKIPNVNSRYSFNFLQCNPIFENAEKEIYQSFLDDINSRFGFGVYFMHKQAQFEHGYDFNFEYENLENIFIKTI